MVVPGRGGVGVSCVLVGVVGGGVGGADDVDGAVVAVGVVKWGVVGV